MPRLYGPDGERRRLAMRRRLARAAALLLLLGTSTYCLWEAYALRTKPLLDIRSGGHRLLTNLTHEEQLEAFDELSRGRDQLGLLMKSLHRDALKEYNLRNSKILLLATIGVVAIALSLALFWIGWKKSRTSNSRMAQPLESQPQRPDGHSIATRVDPE